MYLIFDTETTGLPVRRGASASDFSAWPRMVQLAWEAFDGRGAQTDARSFVIRPVGFTIPKDAEKVHGISTELATRTGVPIQEALAPFVEALGAASVVVAHNFSYDAGVLGAEFYRLHRTDPFRGKTSVCTMQSATEYCGIPGPRGCKWPTLSELHFKLFGKRLAEAHNAVADVSACAKCFFELKRLRVVPLA
jgi:DNA polymerase III epsilon subunit-like protein